MSRAVGVLVAVVAMLAAAAPSQATFPGRNGQIAIVTWADENGSGTIRSYPEYEELVPPGGYDRDPAWSPDGQMLAYEHDVAFGEPSFHIYTVGCCDDDGGLTPGEHPAWSPDGTKIAYGNSGGFGFSYDIHSMNANGSGQVNLTHHAGRDESPAWSPDGTKIAFSSNRDGLPKIYVMNADGSAQTRLSDFTSFEPNWSPNGQKIVFSFLDGADREIGVMDADGTDHTALTNNAYDDVTPVWSPDGTKIAFDLNYGGLVSMNSDGSQQTFLLGSVTYPDWQPIPVNSYARPKAANWTRASLVPAFEPCSAANRTHGPPLDSGACAPPRQVSNQLTVGAPDANGAPVKATGFVTYQVLIGNPNTPADEADVQLRATINDVRNAGTLSDYAGGLSAKAGLRVTDKDNTPHPGGPGAATVADGALAFDVPCTATPDTSVGSTCSVYTSADAVLTGMAKERVRSVWQLGRVEVYDGSDTLFMTQGVFVP